MADIEVTYRLTGNIPIADGSSYTTIDPTVTPTSDNPVKSSGIYQFVESELSNATDSQARSDIHDLTMEVNQLSLELSDKANITYVDNNFATKQELNSKMEFYKIEYIGGALVHDGVSLNYSDIIAKYYDNKYFVYVEGDGYVYIPTLPPLEYDPIIEFSCNYIYNQKAYIARIIINENNQIKYEEVEVVRHDNAVLTVNNIGPDEDGNINVSGGGGVSINDNVIALDTTWSSSKINNNTNSALVPINEHLTNLDNNKADNSALIPINEHLTNLDNNKADNSDFVNLEETVNYVKLLTNPIDKLISTIPDTSVPNNLWLCIYNVECKPNTLTEFELYARFAQNASGFRYIRHSDVQANVGDTQSGNPNHFNVQGTFGTPAVSKLQTGLFTKNYVRNATNSVIKVSIWAFQDSGSNLMVSQRITTKEYIIK